MKKPTAPLSPSMAAEIIANAASEAHNEEARNTEEKTATANAEDLNNDIIEENKFITKVGALLFHDAGYLKPYLRSFVNESIHETLTNRVYVNKPMYAKAPQYQPPQGPYPNGFFGEFDPRSNKVKVPPQFTGNPSVKPDIITVLSKIVTVYQAATLTKIFNKKYPNGYEIVYLDELDDIPRNAVLYLHDDSCGFNQSHLILMTALKFNLAGLSNYIRVHDPAPSK